MSVFENQSTKQKWKKAWASRRFRNKLITGFITIGLVLSAFPIFFQIIENRHGILLHDWLLNRIPSHDVSIFIFLLIWASTLLLLVRFVQDPEILQRFLWCYIFLCLLRMITISLFPLEPPENLLPLADPIANSFYGTHFVTRDLFFSGHTATVFLMALCLKKSSDKNLTFLASLCIGILVLVQHVHYTIDVVAAPVLTFGVYWLGRRIAD
jgi:PAP2 superfamily C-terminal